VTDDRERLRVGPLMAQIEGDVRSRLQQRLVSRGVTEYTDSGLFERVYALLQHTADRHRTDALLLPELIGDDVEWKLEPNLKLSSHRPVVGRAIVFAKRRLVLPLTRWLFDYTQANFRRQQQLNVVLLACLEELAVENARLRRDLTVRSDGSSAT
jgi:hypothetical protein